jgi:hypothetical protein
MSLNFSCGQGPLAPSYTTLCGPCIPIIVLDSQQESCSSGEQLFTLCWDAQLIFNRNVLRKRIPIDIGAVCHNMEIICGSLILCRRYQQGGDIGLNDVALPASWFPELAHVFKILGQIFVQLVDQFLEPLPDLLMLLSSEDFMGESLSFESRPLTGSRVIRSIFTARM